VKRSSESRQDGFLYGSTDPRSEQHEPRLQSPGTENMKSGAKKNDNVKNKENESENKS